MSLRTLAVLLCLAAPAAAAPAGRTDAQRADLAEEILHQALAQSADPSRYSRLTLHIEPRDTLSLRLTAGKVPEHRHLSVSRGLVQLAEILAVTHAADEIEGTRRVDRLVDFYKERSEPAPGHPTGLTLPPGFLDVREDLRPRTRELAQQLLRGVLGYLLLHELGHLEAPPAARSGALPIEMAADESLACAGVRAGLRPRGMTLLLQFQAALERAEQPALDYLAQHSGDLGDSERRRERLRVVLDACPQPRWWLRRPR